MDVVRSGTASAARNDARSQQNPRNFVFSSVPQLPQTDELIVIAFYTGLNNLKPETNSIFLYLLFVQFGGKYSTRENISWFENGLIGLK